MNIRYLFIFDVTDVSTVYVKKNAYTQPQFIDLFSSSGSYNLLCSYWFKLFENETQV
jgi:hypothetical protein